ncbi:MAG: amino acid permease [Candidatus Omnitrophica bacterium]|nr:amino acid permease [Candidatus Omnitrophota bacterium]
MQSLPGETTTPTLRESPGAVKAPVTPQTASQPTLARALGLGDATMLVIGCIVGVGIFRTASSIAAQLSSPSLMLAVWVIGGIVSLCGALCYAELAAMFPSSGGDYVYLTNIYGRFAGFSFGWTKVFIERTGTIAILGYVFAEYARRIAAFDAAWLPWIAAGGIVLLTVVNVAGVRWGTATQNLFTGLKALALGSLIVAGISAIATHRAVAVDWRLPPITAGTWSSLGIALVFVLWTYGGWTEAAYVADEVKQPTKNVPRAIIQGLLLTTALYLLVNASYLLCIPIEQLPTTPLVASQVMQQAIGASGAVFIAGMIACSAFGALNGYILTSGRILYAMGKDHALLKTVGVIHPTFHTPSRALWINAALAILLVFTKTLDQIMTYSTVVISVFYLMAVLGVMILRRRQPEAPRPYRTWGYPAAPLIFLIVMTGFVINTCLKEPHEALFGFGLLLLAIPLYGLSRSRAPS